jgi:hypothetical protein
MVITCTSYPHFIQCFIDTFYGGESISSDTPQSFSCPYCGKLGYTETGLYDHVTSDHTETPYEVASLFLNIKQKFLSCVNLNYAF